MPITHPGLKSSFVVVFHINLLLLLLLSSENPYYFFFTVTHFAFRHSPFKMRSSVLSVLLNTTSESSTVYIEFSITFYKSSYFFLFWFSNQSNFPLSMHFPSELSTFLRASHLAAFSPAPSPKVLPFPPSEASREAGFAPPPPPPSPNTSCSSASLLPTNIFCCYGN